MNRRIRMQQHAPKNWELWQYPQELPSERLRALKEVWDGQGLFDACRTQRVQREMLEHFGSYLHGGVPCLLAPLRRPRAPTLNIQRKRVTGSVATTAAVDAIPGQSLPISSNVELPRGFLVSKGGIQVTELKREKSTAWVLLQTQNLKRKVLDETEAPPP